MKNFLFLSIDDLNDWTNGLAGYSGEVHTPNMDRLMDQGTTFTNAFTQVAICNPSRISVLSGKEPQNTGIFNNQRYQWEDTTAPEETIFGTFKEAGYTSKGLGKLFHTGASEEATAAMFDDYRYFGNEHFDVDLNGMPVGPYTGTSLLRDEVRANHVVDYLADYVPDPDSPLLLSVGLLKPHFDWIVPQEYFDLYPIEDIKIDAVIGDEEDLSQFIRDNSGQNFPWEAEDVPDLQTWKQLVQGYLATISFLDAQVGKILDAVETSAIADNTAIVLWSDHGYHLGDKDVWHKFTLWDNAARAPLIISDPGTVPAGLVVDDVVEMVDIYPTMLDMAGLSSDGLSLDGKSLVPYFEGSAPEGTPEAYTWMYGNVSIRTNDYRYSLYEDGSEELYDIKADPELINNLANDPAHAAAEAELAAQLKAKFNLIGYGEGGADLVGTSQNNVIASVLDGGSAKGGDGDDIYFVAPGMTVIEERGGGRDLIFTQADEYTLPAFVEDLEMKLVANRATGNNGSNVITANAFEIDAKDGNDTVFAGNRTGTYTMGAGDDLIYAGAGNDTVFGGSGNDTLLGEADNDRLLGEDGNDSLLGGGGNDVLSGDADNDTLDGGVGEDALYGGTGNDSLSGSSGLDTLYGGVGDDTLRGGTQSDTLIGEGGNDLLDGGSENDVLSGEDGNDTLDGGSGEDYLFGGAGDDSLRGSAGLDNMYGGIGNDTLIGGLQSDYLVGEWGNDVLSGDDGNDTLIGNQNEDWIFGGAGNDSLTGDEGFDNLYGGIGNDTLLGGANRDTLVGEFGDDVLSGDGGNDLLDGGQDDDWMFGGAGNDSMLGGTGTDNMFGGLDNDTLLGEDGADNLRGEEGNDVLSGGAGNDTLDGGWFEDWLFGGAGNDLMRGDVGFDNLFGSLGDDTLEGGAQADTLRGEQDNDVLSGGDDNDLLDGGTGEDWLFGGAGDDLILGGAGLDHLFGSLGNDTLEGGAQADTLSGEQGSDIFVFADGSGADRVEGFDAFDNNEKLDMRGLSGITDFADLVANHMQQQGNDVVIDAGGGDRITLANVTLADLNPDDFLL